MWTRSNLKEMAKLAFKNNYGVTVVAAFILSFFTGGFTRSQSARESIKSIGNNDFFSIGRHFFNMPEFILGLIITSLIISIFIRILFSNPIIVGGHKFFLVNRVLKANLGIFLHPFKNNYINVVKTMFLKDIYIFFWTLLFIIPGIIKSYSYRMVPFILAENPNIDSNTAISISADMMYGNKLSTFILDLSFIPWHFLSALTFGIAGIFYVFPYVYSTDAELYATLKGLPFNLDSYL